MASPDPVRTLIEEARRLPWNPARLVPRLADALEASEARGKRLSEGIQAVLALHKTWYEVNGERYEERCYIVDDVPADHVCITDRSEGFGEVCDAENGEHYGLGCVECRQANEDGYEARELWPCQTVRLLASCDKDTQP